MPEFLSLKDVLKIHRLQLDQWGGSDGVRDLGAIESAVAQAQATFDGEYLHEGPFEMAAAYAFHLAEAQGFIDGNKRAGAHAAIAFLALNGIFLVSQDDDVIYLALMEIAAHTMTKTQLASLLRELSSSRL